MLHRHMSLQNVTYALKHVACMKPRHAHRQMLTHKWQFLIHWQNQINQEISQSYVHIEWKQCYFYLQSDSWFVQRYINNMKCTLWSICAVLLVTWLLLVTRYMAHNIPIYTTKNLWYMIYTGDMVAVLVSGSIQVIVLYMVLKEKKQIKKCVGLNGWNGLKWR